MNKNTKMYAMTGITIIVVGALSFYGGMRYQMTQRPSFASGQFGNRMGGVPQNGTQNRQGMLGQRPVMGEILSQDDTSMTVKTQDGGSKIVLFSDKTVINKASQGAKIDLKVGEQITVFGTQNQDGSITAQNVSIGAIPTQSAAPSVTPAVKK